MVWVMPVILLAISESSSLLFAVASIFSWNRLKLSTTSKIPFEEPSAVSDVCCALSKACAAFSNASAAVFVTWLVSDSILVTILSNVDVA